MQADIFHGNTIYRLSFLRLLVKINSEISIHYALLLNENIKKLQCRIIFRSKINLSCFPINLSGSNDSSKFNIANYFYQIIRYIP